MATQLWNQHYTEHASDTEGRSDVSTAKKLAASRPLFDPEIVGRATEASFGKLNPVTLIKNPVMFVVEVGAALTTVFLVRDMFSGAPGIGFAIPDLALAVVHGAVRELCRGYGGSARQSPSRQSAED